MAVTIGLDTSNYTTSAAVFDGAGGRNLGKLLEVPKGALGLRQSDALFQHVKQIPLLMEQLQAQGTFPDRVDGVGASVKPRWVEGSYMPCFLAGESQGRSLAALCHVPFYPCAHQQGHLAAAAWSAGRMELLDRPFLAWHLSGGTTELLYVEPAGHTVAARRIGGTTDLSAGQLIDRAGLLLGLDFPAGKALDLLARYDGGGPRPFSVKRNGLEFSLSGMENQVRSLRDAGTETERVAAFVLDTVASVVRRTTEAALEQFSGLPVLCSGGVASNRRLRAVLGEIPGVVFAAPEYATDNAMGVAILAHRALTRRAAG